MGVDDLKINRKQWRTFATLKFLDFSFYSFDSRGEEVRKCDF